jgi:Domain of unknown function (DUF4440)
MLMNGYVAVFLLVVIAVVIPGVPQQSSTDEQELREIQEQLARAWVARDRQTIERILAPEWSVITADAMMLPRVAVLDAALGSNAPTIEAMTTDDVTVVVYGSAAVVRGRTEATAAIRGTPQTTRVWFTDVCVKRDGAWRVVASHQTRIAR